MIPTINVVCPSAMYGDRLTGKEACLHVSKPQFRHDSVFGRVVLVSQSIDEKKSDRGDLAHRTLFLLFLVAHALNNSTVLFRIDCFVLRRFPG